MRKYSADFILNHEGRLVTDHLLVADDEGRIIDLFQGSDSGSVHYDGILSPGFINTHCHLELSHLKNQIIEGTGLDGFIRDLVRSRTGDSSKIPLAIFQADCLMWEQGIQGVGDICNTDQTFETKQSGKIRYHSFIELFNFKPDEAALTFKNGMEKYNAAVISHKNASIIPHAPYSVTPELFQLIAEHHLKQNSPWCIHNQESAAENKMFINKSGVLWDLFKSLGIGMSWFQKTGKNSLPSVCSWFPDDTNLLFVHNTFTSASDIDFLKSKKIFDRSWFSLCARANLYIEKKLPDIKMLHESGCQITIGTDSLASNDTLSVLEEIKTIHNYFPGIAIETLLKWATSNGAGYFKWEDLGKFRKGHQPGIVNITNANNRMLGNDCRVKRIV